MPFEFSRSRASRTTEMYQSVYGDWERWCASIDARPLPATADKVLEFLRAREPTHSTSALSARKSAIIAAHCDARARLPDVERPPYLLEHDDKLKMGWKEIMRRKGNRHIPREAVGAVKLKDILRAIPYTAAGAMDRAILLIGFACTLRRSEIAALNRDDIDIQGDTMYVHIRRSKTDQIGNGVVLAAARAASPDNCPVSAMENWLAAGRVTDGPLFRHPKFQTPKRICNEYTYLAIRRYAAKVGMNPKPLGAHSLRRGGITEIHEAGIDAKAGMQLSRHRTPGIYFSYVADKEASKNPAIHALARSL